MKQLWVSLVFQENKKDEDCPGMFAEWKIKLLSSVQENDGFVIFLSH